MCRSWPLAELLSLVHAAAAARVRARRRALLLVALAAWLRAGRPRPPLPPRPSFRALDRRRCSPSPSLAGLGYELFVLVASPPNNWDSMHYHLARVAAWHAQRDLGYFPTHNSIENAYPQNAELLVLWTVTFLGRDVVAALPQLLASLATATSVFVIARRIGYERRASAFSALLFPTLTIVALESVTTQNDLIEASFVAAAVALALGRTRAETVLAGARARARRGDEADVPLRAARARRDRPARPAAAAARSSSCCAAVAGFALLGHVRLRAEHRRDRASAGEGARRCRRCHRT